MLSLHGHFGFDPVHSMLVDLRMAGFSGEQESGTQRRMLDAVGAIPGVNAAALTDALLLTDTNATNIFSDTTTDLRASQVAAAPFTFHVSPAYLQAEGTPLVAGRSFTQSDDKNSPRVAVVNRELARRLFGSETAAIGRSFKMSDGTRVGVVGIAENGKYGSLTEDPHPAMFLPLAQWPSGIQWMVIRSGRDPRQLGAEIRRALHQVDAGLPVQVEKRYDEMVTVLFGPKMATLALGVLGLMGALLSITGIFGMAAYSVSKRMRELGIRIALGARRREVLESALGRALRLLGLGAAAGLLLGVIASRVLAAVVYQATPRDPLVLAAAVVAMALVGMVAAWIPAQRALSIDPAILLREE
jgi:ABC-type antimicrobial peptide transport system permease subunit